MSKRVKRMTASEAKKNYTELFKQLGRGELNTVIITDKNKQPQAVALSIHEFFKLNLQLKNLQEQSPPQ